MHRRAVINSLHTTAFTLFCLMPLLLALTRAGADIAACVIGAFFLIRSALSNDWEWLKNPGIALLVALWLYLMAVSLLADDPHSAFMTAAAWGRMVAFFAAAGWVLAPSEKVRHVWHAGFCILLLLAVDTGWQYVTGTSLSGHKLFQAERLTGPMTHPNIGNLMLKTWLPMLGAALYALHGRHAWRCWLLGVFTLVLMTLVMVSGERSSALLMLLGAGVTAAVCFLRMPKMRLQVLGSVGAVALLVAAVVYTQYIVDYRIRILRMQLGDFRHSPYGQLYITAFRLWQQHPWLGIGAGQFRRLCWPNMAQFGITYCDIHPHNMYFEWLSEGGLIGFALFVAAMAALVWRFLKTSAWHGLKCLPLAFGCGALAVLLFPVVVTQSQFANWSAVLFWYGLSLALYLPGAIRRG